MDNCGLNSIIMMKLLTLNLVSINIYLIFLSTNKYNLSISEIESLCNFSKNKPFKVVECDKNVGVCLISNDNYNTLCLSLLNDINTYEQIPADPINLVNETIKTSLDNLLSNKDISEKLYEKLFTSKNKLGSFRILSIQKIANCILAISLVFILQLI